MRKIFLSGFVFVMSLMTSLTLSVYAQQVPNADFEDWSGDKFDGKEQPKYWKASNVEQVGMKFNFAHKETGHNGGYCMMVQDQEVGAMGITEVSPGYFSMGNAWVYLEGLNTGSATAGTKGGMAWTYRPDTMSVWIKRTGDNVTKEDFYLLYYAWVGTTRGDRYGNKNGGCTTVTNEDEESDIRQALNPNRCGTVVKGTQVAEGLWREMKHYGEWTNIRVPIYYFNDTKPEKANFLFSASNYPNGASSDGLYKGNSLYVDDVELIYSSKIQKLFVNEMEWKGFDPNSKEVQAYALGENATEIPSIVAVRGAGTLTNARGVSASFPGRTLSGSEIKIENGDLVSKPTTITVKSEDGKSTTVYKIQFQKAASSNTKLAGISYTVGGKTIAVPDFSPSKMNYTVDLPYGTTDAPVISAEKQEDAQSVAITQATSPTGSAKIVVTAANKQATATYNLTFRVAELADNTLADIKVNGKSIPGFTPTQAIYKVSLPVGTKTLTVEPVSAYGQGAQTIVVTPATMPTGDAINGAAIQISVTTPGNTVAKVYKLNIKLEASSYTFLSNLEVEGAELNFDPEKLTYSVNLPMGTKTLPQILYSRGDEYQKVEIASLGEGVVEGTVRITVTAGNGDQTVYKIIFSVSKSEISTLRGIKIGGVDLDGFAPDKTSYDYVLPVGAKELPTIEPIRADEYQEIVVTTGGLNGKTRITVTAGNGSTTIYQITFSVATFSDNTLKSLSVDGYEIAFDPKTTEYSVNLAKGTSTLPNVTYELQDPQFQTATVRAPTSLNGDYKITVRPSSGASLTYIIHFSLDKSSNTALKAIYLDGTALAAFHADTLHYIDSLPEGVSRIPNVTFEKSEAGQRVLSVLEDNIQVITVTAESGAVRTYRIEFIVRVSANAFLQMIYLDGEPLADFESETLNYEVQLTSDRCPQITVGKEAGQQVTITAPYAAGEAQIKVQPGIGSANIYRITFKAAAAATVRLDAILVDGVPVTGFDPANTLYHVSYTKTLPQIKGVSNSEDLTVSEPVWNDSVAWIYIADAQGNKAAYEVVCHRALIGETGLKAIKADGVLIDGFKADSLNYAYSLPAGSTYPEITYEAMDETQVAFFGQTGEGAWEIVVVAENGAKALYRVVYTVAKYNDPTPADLQVEGQTLAFKPEQTQYELSIDEGAPLPELTATPKQGQTVMTYNLNDTVQQVIVTAESGAEKTYNVKYSRIRSSNAALANIRINGQNLDGFRADKFNYTYTLPKSTKVIPNVFPVGQLDNQTITTFYSRPNGTTRIVVEAQDGTQAEYTVTFPVELASSTKLGSLKINGDEKDVEQTDFLFTLPYGAVSPYEVEFTKDEEEQLIDFTKAPISEPTVIRVKAQNGDTRTYTIRYQVTVPEGDNTIVKVAYNYVNAAGQTIPGEIVPVKGENTVNLPYGAKSFEVTQVTKSYPEQSIILYNGGIRRGAKIIAQANRTKEEDAVFTLVPVIAPDTIGKLKSLSYIKDGVTIPVPHFSPDVYNYMITVKEQPTADTFVPVAYGGKAVSVGNPTTTAAKKNKLVTIRVADGKTYSVCWFYEEDEAPLTFNWVQTDKAHYYTKEFSLVDYTSVEDAGEREPTGYKPKGWSVPADLLAGVYYDAVVSSFVYNSGKEVTRIGEREAILSTIRGGALNSSLPGAMTLGKLSLPDGVGLNGATNVSFNRSAAAGIKFRNTPQAFEFEYQPIISYGIDAWNAWVSLAGTSGESIEHVLSGNYGELGKWKTASQPLSYDFTVNAMNILLCASELSGSSLGIYSGSEAKSCDLQIRNVRFVYNSELTSATINGTPVNPVGNTFTLDVSADYVGIPELTFKGKVNDQTRTIEWLNDGEWKDGKLTARVINYGENLQDSTHYYVVLQRAAVESLDYTIDFFGSYTKSSIGEDTILVKLPYGRVALPDSIVITPASMHQQFSVSKSENALTVTVTAENGSTKTDVYVFRQTVSDDAKLVALFADDGEVELELKTSTPDTTLYTMKASGMPEITYALPDDAPGQTVALVYTADSVTLYVTSPDGAAHHTYILRRIEPNVATDGQLTDFRAGEEELNLGGTTYSLVKERTEDVVFFTRKYNTDSVVFIQSPQKMEWQTYGSENKTYTWTYPTEKSSKATLAALRLNGRNYDEFAENLFEYSFETDSALVLTAVAAESTQTLATTQTIQSDSIIFSTVVTAEDNTHSQTYTFTVHAPKSDDNTLSAIYMDGVLIPGFRADSTDYTVTVPAPAYKLSAPQMPSLTYQAAQEGQTVVLTPSLTFGEPTEIAVTSQMGTLNTYFVTVLAAPSTCSELSGITVNGEAIDRFEPGRHFYSVWVASEDPVIGYTSRDAFQTVVRDTTVIKEAQHYIYGLTVKAESGMDSTYYQVEVYIENKSNDAHLANITLDGKDFVDFERALNSNLTFDPGQNQYTINLPSGSTVLPEVSAQLKMDGQTVVIDQFGDTIQLTVTAVDGTVNQYKLCFVIPKSKNANLSMIFLNGDSLQGFDPNYYFYQINLPVGVHELPEVAAQKQESVQTLAPIVPDPDKLETTITVSAEDPDVRENNYVLVFQYTRSDADTLLMIMADGDSLQGFAPQTTYYSFSLPVGTTGFPSLDYEPADEWQTVSMDTVDNSANTLIRRLFVTSESGKKNTYTVAYTILMSEVDSLQMILVDQKPLADFNAATTEYFYTLSIEKAAELGDSVPAVDYVEGDAYQTIKVGMLPETISGKTLANKSVITAIAQNGQTRIYTIHYLVELSAQAAPEAILLNGDMLPGFDAERFAYRLELPVDAAMPVVSVVKKENTQTYDIRVGSDTIQVMVWAENGDSLIYTITFERLLSANTLLRDVILRDAEGEQYTTAQFPFRADVYEYSDIEIPYQAGVDPETLLPSMEILLSDSLQTVDTVHYALPNGDIQVDITVTAPNGEDQAVYSLTFRFIKPSEASLLAIFIGEEPLEDFDSEVSDYLIKLPYGTAEEDFISPDDISYVLADSLATATVSVDETHQLTITVVAQDGVSERSYFIRQEVAKDSNNDLRYILLNGDTLRGFAPEITFYTYLLAEGAPVPMIEAEAVSENAELSIKEVSAGDTCVILCKAEDESIKRYYIHFAVSEVSDGIEASSTDVLLKRIPGTNKIMIATIRKAVSFAMYDQTGHLTYYHSVPVADPNDSDVHQDANGNDVLNNVSDTSEALIIEVASGQVYFYSFFVSDKKIVKTGKFYCL